MLTAAWHQLPGGGGALCPACLVCAHWSPCSFSVQLQLKVCTCAPGAASPSPDRTHGTFPNTGEDGVRPGDRRYLTETHAGLDLKHEMFSVEIL